MKTLLGMCTFVIASLVLTGCNDSGHSVVTEVPIKPATGIAGDGRLDSIVDFIRAQNGLPALAAMMVHDGRVIEKSAMGKRSTAADVPVSVDDQWHIGSITKSMTSTLAALLVKQGYVRWDSTLREVFPELIGIMLPEYQDVRLEELLSHTSGLPVVDLPDFESYYVDQRALGVQRQEIVAKILTLESTSTRGTFEYSNMGYIIAGAMLEKVTGSEWETLLQSYVFDALAMTQAGFGAPDTQGTLSQPVGHAIVDGIWYPVDPTVESIADMPRIVGPAGTVHASLEDMAAYLGVHLKGLRGDTVDGFLAAQEFSKIHTPVPNSSYALGWVVNGESIVHDGSNSIWYAFAAVNAEKNTALFLVTNAVDDLQDPNSKMHEAIAQLVGELSVRADAAFP